MSGQKRWGKSFSILMQAYAVIGLSVIVMLILSSTGAAPSLKEYITLESRITPLVDAIPDTYSLTSVSGAIVAEEPVKESEPEPVVEVVLEEEIIVKEEPVMPEIILEFEPASAQSLTTLVTADDVTVGTLTVTNPGKAVTNVKASILSPEGLYIPDEVRFGSLKSGESRSEEVVLTFTDAVLANVSFEVPLTIVVGFADDNNFLHEKKSYWTYPVLSHRILDNAPKGYVRFIPKKDVVLEQYVAQHLGGVRAKDSIESQRLSARWIFESLQTLEIEVLPDNRNEARFPAETLSERKGSPTDLAILFAGLLHHTGFDTALVIQGDDIMAAYVDSRGYVTPVMADAEDYNDALDLGLKKIMEAEYEVLRLGDGWSLYSSARFPSGLLELGDWPALTRQNGRCTLEYVADEVTRAKVPVRLSNTGDAPGLGCVGLVAYVGEQRSGEKFMCYVVKPGQMIDTELTHLVMGDDPSCEDL